MRHKACQPRLMLIQDLETMGISHIGSKSPDDGSK